MSKEYFKLCLSKTNTCRLVIEPKQSVNAAWQITEMPNSAKRKFEIPPEKRTTDFQLSRTVFAHNLALSVLFYGFLVNTYCCYCNSDFVQLFNLVFDSGHDSELGKPPQWCRRRRVFHSSDTLLVERHERLNSFQNRWEGLQRYFPLIIFFM